MDELENEEERTQEIEEGETDHRIAEYDATTRRFDEVLNSIKALTDVINERFNALTGIAVDNGGMTVASEVEEEPTREIEGVDNEALTADWESLGKMLSLKD